MFERLNPVFKLICVLLAALVLYQFASFALPKKRAGSEFAFGNAKYDPSISTNAESQLSPAISAQIDKIRDSQILGMIMRPPPMAVLGIAGRDVLLRGPTGQTGLVREGEQLGGVKILRIGTNRVLVEHEGQQKELTLFQGFGSESLLPKK